MADRYLLESGAPDGYLLEDGSGVLLLEGVNAPFSNSVGVNANPTKRKIGGFVEIGQTLLLATLAAVAATTVFRDPFVTTVAKPKAAQHEVGTNSVLLRTAAVQNPFRQNDWAVPSRVRHPVADRQGVNAKLLSVKPHNQNDWYAGAAKRSVQQPDNTRSYLTSVQTQFAPFAQNDWGNPVSQRKALRVTYHRPSFDPGAPVAPGVAPFYQSDWQNPVWLKDRFGSQTLDLTVYAADKPFAQNDWQNPVRAPSRITVTHYRPSLDPNAPVVPGAAPFYQNDWQNPVWLKDRFGSQTLDLTVYAADRPFAQPAWDNPVWPRKALRVEHHRPSFDPGAPISPGVAPFYQADWQNPVWLKDRFGSQTLDLTVYAADKPFAQTVWDNPVRTKSRIAVTHHRPAFDPTAPVAPSPPFYQNDWQNPVWLKDRFGSQTFDLTVYAADKPFAQNDWQNPVCRPKTAQDFLQSGASLVLTTVVLRPFSQNDWQNPKYFVPRDPRFSLEGTPLPNEIPPAVAPPPAEPPRGDGGWRRKHRGPDYKRFEDKRRKDKEFEDELRALYAELIGDPKAAEIAAEIVEPITASEAAIPPPSQVRFEYATDEIETALLLLELRIDEFKAERAKAQQIAAEKLAVAQEAIRLREAEAKRLVDEAQAEEKRLRDAEEKRLADEAEAVELDELMELYDLFEIIQNLN